MQINLPVLSFFTEIVDIIILNTYCEIADAITGYSIAILSLQCR